MSGSRKLLLALAAAAMSAACERVVSVTLEDAPPRLVVIGRIERVEGNVSGAQTIQLMLTNAYFDSSAPPPARTALVRVADDAGNSVTFAESAPGVYTTTSLMGEVGRVYTLTISYGGEQFEATDTLRAVPPIDTLYLAEPEFEFGDVGGLRATIDFREPGGIENWYLWEQFVNGERLLGPDSAFRLPVVGNDLALEGRAVERFQPFSGRPVAPMDTVIVRQLSISGAAYRYFTALGEQATNDGSPFAVPASSVRGNVRNVTNPAMPALGYFMATNVSEARRP